MKGVLWIIRQQLKWLYDGLYHQDVLQYYANKIESMGL